MRSGLVRLRTAVVLLCSLASITHGYAQISVDELNSAWRSIVESEGRRYARLSEARQQPESSPDIDVKYYLTAWYGN